MRTYKELWQMIEPLVKEEGLELYDIERGSGGSSSRSGRSTIRIFLSKDKTIKPVTDLVADEAIVNSDSVDSDAKVDDSDQGLSAGREGGVSLEECALISRKIAALDRFEEVIPPETTLEVSSPGINRNLRLPFHFQMALGEHIYVKGRGRQLATETDFDDENIGKANGQDVDAVDRVLRGTLKYFKNDAIVVKEDKSDKIVLFNLADISSARVDFIF